MSVSQTRWVSRRPVTVPGPPGFDPFEGRRRRPEPRLAFAEPHHLPPGVGADGDADSEGTRCHQDKRADAPGVPDRVQHRDVRTRGAPEQVHPGEAEMLAQRLDVVDQTIAAVGGGSAGVADCPMPRGSTRISRRRSDRPPRSLRCPQSCIGPPADTPAGRPLRARDKRIAVPSYVARAGMDKIVPTRTRPSSGEPRGVPTRRAGRRRQVPEAWRRGRIWVAAKAVARSVTAHGLACVGVGRQVRRRQPTQDRHGWMRQRPAVVMPTRATAAGTTNDLVAACPDGSADLMAQTRIHVAIRFDTRPDRAGQSRMDLPARGCHPYAVADRLSPSPPRGRSHPRPGLLRAGRPRW